MYIHIFNKVDFELAMNINRMNFRYCLLKKMNIYILKKYVLR